MSHNPRNPLSRPNPSDDLDAYLGLDAREAERRAEERGWRTVRSLPPGAIVTMEYVAGRLNFTVDAGRVQRCWQG
ncbi:I78 family peptidase inhibitor [Actinacidiphila alni]|uniref:I78 family peptidase inhibitor n=1 Tax=Actinacidiphila alni TaxID=380248 RepID=UPI0034521933